MIKVDSLTLLPGTFHPRSFRLAQEMLMQSWYLMAKTKFSLKFLSLLVIEIISKKTNIYLAKAKVKARMLNAEMLTSGHH